MNNRNGDGDLQAAALYGFELLTSATLRAIREGKMKAVACRPDGITSTVSIEGRHYKLESAEPGALKEILDAEPAVMAEQAEAIGQLVAVGNIAKEAIVQNAHLRQLLSPLEETVMITTGLTETGDVASVRSIKKLR